MMSYPDLQAVALTFTQRATNLAQENYWFAKARERLINSRFDQKFRS